MEQSELVDKILSAIRDGGNVSEIENILSKPGVEDLLKTDSGEIILNETFKLGLTNISSLLFSRGLPYKPVKPNENSYLHMAIMNRDTNLASQLIELGADIEVLDSDKNTPLLLAIYMNDPHMVKLLLEKGALVSYREKKAPFLQSPFSLAVERNRLDVVKNMFEYRSKIPLKEVQQAMYRALYNCLDTIVQFFVANNVELDESICKNTTILHIAAEYGCASTVEYIVDEGMFPVNVLNDHKRTPLHSICINCNNGYLDPREAHTLQSIVEFLIDRGAEINLIDSNGMTPVMYTVKAHNHPISTVLLSHNANTNVLKNNETVLFWAFDCDMRRDCTLVQLILNCGGYESIDHVNDVGLSPITKCIQMNNAFYIRLLINYFADIEGKYFDGRKVYDVIISTFDECKYVLEELKLYLYFMTKAKLYVSPACTAEIQALLPGESLVCLPEIEEESKALQAIRLNDSLTAWDIFVKPLSSLLPVCSVLMGELPFLKELPLHQNIILKKILCLKRKKERLELIRKASSRLLDMINVSLPVLVLDIICQHLSNEELNLLLS